MVSSLKEITVGTLLITAGTGLVFPDFWTAAYGQEAGVECPEYLEEYRDGELVKLLPDCDSYAEHNYFKPLKPEVELGEEELDEDIETIINVKITIIDNDDNNETPHNQQQQYDLITILQDGEKKE